MRENRISFSHWTDEKSGNPEKVGRIASLSLTPGQFITELSPACLKAMLFTLCFKSQGWTALKPIAYIPSERKPICVGAWRWGPHYMYKQQHKDHLLVKPVIRTRMHRGKVFKTQKPRLEKYKKNPMYEGALIWNALPSETRNIPTFDLFKQFLKNWAQNMTQNLRIQGRR